MVALRIILFLGMLIHKLIWEVMKSGDKTPHLAVKKPPVGWLKMSVKFGKSLVLLFLVIQTLFLEIFPISSQPALFRIFGIVVYFAGLCIAILGRVQLGKNWSNLEDYQVLPDQTLVQTGIYAYIRHPIYIGDVLLVLGLELALNSWLVLAVVPLLLYVIRQAVNEETILSEAFPNYKTYRKRTKMFIPYLI